MDLLSNLALGFGVAFTPINLMYCLIGCILGTLIGVLPGIGPVATIAMLLPATYALPPVSALIMLAGIYYGAQYGGSTTAILVNLPGESSSVVTTIDGYQMARKGRAGPALAAAGLGSFFAGSVGTLILAAFAPPLTELAFKFGRIFLTHDFGPGWRRGVGFWLLAQSDRDDHLGLVVGSDRYRRQLWRRTFQF